MWVRNKEKFPLYQGARYVGGTKRGVPLVSRCKVWQRNKEKCSHCITVQGKAEE